MIKKYLIPLTIWNLCSPFLLTQNLYTCLTDIQIRTGLIKRTDVKAIKGFGSCPGLLSDHEHILILPITIWQGLEWWLHTKNGATMTTWVVHKLCTSSPFRLKTNDLAQLYSISVLQKWLHQRRLHHQHGIPAQPGLGAEYHRVMRNLAEQTLVSRRIPCDGWRRERYR